MAENLQPAPKLDRVPDNELVILQESQNRILDEVFSVHASRLREDPALRSLTEVVRSTPEMWEQVAPFVGRRADFRDTYALGSRVFAPLLSGLIYSAPELVDAALQLGTSFKSEQVRNALESTGSVGAEPYVPVLVIGSGPQSQIFNAELQQRLADVQTPAVTIERNSHMGGTFRPGDAMDFRLNSRTRPQTEARPQPGTSANINDIRPGIMTPGDVTAEAYIPAKEFGRVVALNHAFASEICLGMTVESIGVNPASQNGQPGNIAVVLSDRDSGERFMVRSDNVVIASGLGEEKARTFGDKKTQGFMEQEQARLARGEDSLILTAEQLIREIDSGNRDFPLKGKAKIAVVGNGDGARVVVGKLLGYEPRNDKSVTQLDFIESVDWFGQTADTLEEFVGQERLRYAQLGLEFPRESNSGRFSRVTAIDSRATQLMIPADNRIVKVTTETGTMTPDYDLVIVATGYEPISINSLRRKPLTVKQALEMTDGQNPTDLKVGDLIEYAPGFSLNSIEIIATKDKDLLVRYTKPDKTFGYFNIPNTPEATAQYLNPEAILGKEIKREPFSFKGLLSYSSFVNLGSDEQIAMLSSGSTVWAYRGRSDQILRVIGRDDDTQLLSAEIVTFAKNSASVENIQLSTDEVIEDIRSRAYVVFSAPYAFDAPNAPENAYTNQPLKIVGTAAVVKGLQDGTIPSGSLLVDSHNKSNVSIIDCNQLKENGGSYQITNVNDGEILQGQQPISPSELEQYIIDNNLDTFAVPPEVFTTYSELPKDEPNSEEIRLNTLKTVDENGQQKAVANVTIGIPGVYVVGPPTNIPVDPELTKLIPAIPENPVSMFASAENVRATADIVAQDVRRQLVNVPLGDRLILSSASSFPVTLIGAKEVSIDTNSPVLEMSVTPRSRRFEPALPKTQGDKAVLLTLAMLIRGANFRTATGTTHSITFGLQSDTSSGGIKVVIPARSAGLVSNFKKRQRAFFDYLIGDPLVSEYVAQQFKSSPQIDISLVFNERGLDVQSTQILPIRKPKIIGKRPSKAKNTARTKN